MMIEERPDFKTLDPADILERLNALELKLSEKRELYGTTPKVRTLKAKARKWSSDEDSEADSDDPEALSRELALLTRKFHKFSQRNRFGGSSRSTFRKTKNDDSVDSRKRVCHKCKKPGHYIADCPRWEKEAKLKKKKKKKSKDDSSDEKSKKKSARSSKSDSYRNIGSCKARAYLGKEMRSEESNSDPEAEE